MATRGLQLTAVLGVALLAAACGGSAATATPAASGAPSPSAAASQPVAASTAPSAAPGESAASSFDIGEITGAAEKLDSLTSYKITMSMVSSEGTSDITITTVRKPVESQRFETSSPDGGSFVVVTIGDKAWVSQDGTTFVSTPASTVAGMTQLLTPEALLGTFQQEALPYLGAGTHETKNGVPATHYHFDDTTPLPPTAESTIPPGASGDIWVADEGFLVALEASGFGEDDATLESLSLQVTNINDPSLKVEAPE